GGAEGVVKFGLRSLDIAQGGTVGLKGGKLLPGSGVTNAGTFTVLPSTNTTIGSTATFLNKGTFQAMGLLQTAVTVDMPFTNHGQVNDQGTILIFAGGGSSSGEFNIDSGDLAFSPEFATINKNAAWTWSGGTKFTGKKTIDKNRTPTVALEGDITVA